MPLPTLENVHHLAVETGFQPSVLEKTLRHLICCSKSVGIQLYRNGWPSKAARHSTIFSLILNGSPSISTSISSACSARLLLKLERPVVEAALQGLLLSQGYVVRRKASGHAGGKWLLHYNSVLSGRGNL